MDRHVFTVGIVRAVHVIPSELEAAFVLEFAPPLATNNPKPKAKPSQLLVVGIVRAVQVMPSELEAAFAELGARAMNTSLQNLTHLHVPLVGKVRAVQVMPSELEAAMVPVVLDIATKVPLP